MASFRRLSSRSSFWARSAEERGSATTLGKRFLAAASSEDCRRWAQRSPYYAGQFSPPERRLSRLSQAARELEAFETKTNYRNDIKKDLQEASIEELDRILRTNKFDYVRFEQPDMHGLAKCRLIPINHFKKKMKKGVNFSLSHLIRDPMGQKVFDTGLWYEKGMGDAVGIPDLASFRILPWYESAARVIVDMRHADNTPVDAHPRNIARKQVERLDAMGISILAAHEFEFVVESIETREPIFSGSNCGFTMNIARAESLVKQFSRFLPAMGLNVETIESEAGPGQLEITYSPTTGMSIGDNGHTLKTSIKEICLNNGYLASFRSKHSESCTSSSHFCHSLWDSSNTRSLLHDSDHPQGLSTLAQHWIAGLVRHAPAVTLLLCPTLNCLDRLGTSLATPTTASWGVDNRSCAFRVSLPAKGNANPDAMFIENRIGGAGGNPYLTMAVNIAAGIDGIRNRLPLMAATEGVAPGTLSDPSLNLPRTMSDSLDALLADDVICEALGKDFIKCFTALKRHEMDMQKEAEARGDHSWMHSFFQHI